MTPSGRYAAAAFGTPRRSWPAPSRCRSSVTSPDASRTAPSTSQNRRIGRRTRHAVPPIQLPSCPALRMPSRAPSPSREPGIHAVLGTPIASPWPEGTGPRSRTGCWGRREAFWDCRCRQHSRGYASGYTYNPTYRGHARARPTSQVVLVAFDPKRISYEQLLSRRSGRTATRPRACARATTSAQYRSIIIPATWAAPAR